MKELDIQLKKQENKKNIDFKLIILTKYHDFLNVFSKKKVDILSFHKNHDHRIKLEENKTHKYALLYNMLNEELLLIKKYLQKQLNKEFIKANIAFYISLILFAKKSDEELRFCVNYQKLNAIIKKNKIRSR